MAESTPPRAKGRGAQVNPPNRYAHREGEADLPCHLAMARHEAHVGRDAEAQRRVEATLTLFPYSAEAWTLKAQLAAKAGDEEGRQRALVEAAALSAEPLAPRPFGMPGPAQG